jgi:hypothetical protein
MTADVAAALRAACGAEWRGDAGSRNIALLHIMPIV